MQEFLKKFNLDIGLIISLILVIAYGCLILYSASGANQNVIINQIIRILIGLIALIIIAQIPMRYWINLIPWVFFINLLLLILVLWMGYTTKGAERWIDLGIVRFQPSETMKLVLPILIARIVYDYDENPKFLKIVLALILIAIVFALILLQPDLGTALLVGISALFVLFLSAIPFSYIVVFTSACLVAIPLAWQFLLHEYQKQRIIIFMDPQSDPLGSGYHIIQSKIAIGSGGFWGKGYLQGTQSQLDFLPERTTDFIFSVMAEELGLLGIIILFILYCLIITQTIKIIKNTNYQFEKLVGCSILFIFMSYIVINIGMISGLLPIVGLPLPLVSYGGTSMLSILASFGILLSIKNIKGRKYY